MQQWRAEILCDIPFFDIESVVMTGVNFTAVPAGIVVGLVLPKPVQREIKMLEILSVISLTQTSIHKKLC